MVELITDRENDLRDYLNNTIEDPEERGDSYVDTVTLAAGTTEYQLENNKVKYVADTISVAGSIKSKGFHYTVEYGVGEAMTIITFTTPLAVESEVIINYHCNVALVEKGFSRSATKLPRIVMTLINGDEDYAALGDQLEDGKGVYINANYRIEIRDIYATRCKKLASKVFNSVMALRHKDLFRVNITRANGLKNFDYDPDKDCYIWQFNCDIQWELIFIDNE